ncbi:MAG TPA: hypothetical protein P5137_06325 [Candidatus Brocadiia bacterium]|nr:hypothetical protein [Candidatus Brocadiia bacterium]
MSHRLRVVAAATLACCLAAGCAGPLLYTYAKKDYAQRAQAEAAQRQNLDAIRRACLKAPPASCFNAPLLFVVPSSAFVRANIVIEAGQVPAHSDVLDYVLEANLREMRFDAGLLQHSGLFRTVETVEAANGNGEEDNRAAIGGYSIHCVSVYRGGVKVWGYDLRGPNLIRPVFISSLDIRHAALNGWDSLVQIIKSGR